MYQKSICKILNMSLFNKIFVGVSLAILVIGCGNKTDFSDRILAVEKSQFIKHADDWRNLRYGEIIPVFKNKAQLHVEVYNSVTCNELPQELWEKLNAKKMAETYDAKTVILNGPRYWLINKMEGRGKTSEGKVVNFGGIEMRLVATLNSNIFSGTVGDKLYTENEVKRETTYHYYKDNMVYELTSPKGKIYRMQSYTTMKDPTLTIDKLENLGNSLDLPKGWSYEAKILKENSIMAANGVAYVINDELGNSYQRILQK